jgi:hypothetical protein
VRYNLIILCCTLRISHHFFHSRFLVPILLELVEAIGVFQIFHKIFNFIIQIHIGCTFLLIPQECTGCAVLALQRLGNLCRKKLSPQLLLGYLHTRSYRFTRNNLLIVLSLIYFVLHMALNVMMKCILTNGAAMEQSHLFSLH